MGKLDFQGKGIDQSKTCAVSQSMFNASPSTHRFCTLSEGIRDYGNPVINGDIATVLWWE